MLSDHCFKKGGGVCRNNFLTTAEVERTVYCAVLVQVHRSVRGVAPVAKVQHCNKCAAGYLLVPRR